MTSHPGVLRLMPPSRPTLQQAMWGWMRRKRNLSRGSIVGLIPLPYSTVTRRAWWSKPKGGPRSAVSRTVRSKIGPVA